MDAYCSRKSISAKSHSFVFEGQPISASSTPLWLEMDDDVQLDFRFDGDNGADNSDLDLPTKLNLRVNGQDGETMHFRVQFENFQLGTLMDSYCARTNTALESYEFLFRNTRVSPSSTPLELEMKEGDEMFAILHAVGFERIGPGHGWCVA
jgi:hypothetical protein